MAKTLTQNNNVVHPNPHNDEHDHETQVGERDAHHGGEAEPRHFGQKDRGDGGSA